MNTYIALLGASFATLAFSFPSYAAERFAPVRATAPVCELDDSSCIVISEKQSFELNDIGSIDFIGIPEDSRCPVDVYCFWAGLVRVEFKQQAFGNSQKFELGIGGNLSQIWQDEATGIQLSLEQVWPERNLSEPSQEPYQIKLRIINSSETPDSPEQEGPEQDSPAQDDQAV